MSEDEKEAQVRFYNSLADLVDLICRKIEDNEFRINIHVEKEE